MRPEADAPLVARLGTVTITAGATVREAAPDGGEVGLTLTDGSTRRVEHVVLATGYKVDLDRYAFLAPELLAEIRCVDGYPVLDGGFETSVGGLHFVGATAAWSFGPLMRFIAGSGYAAARVTAAARAADRRSSPVGAVRGLAATPGR
jgi:hypothetical protein